MRFAIGDVVEFTDSPVFQLGAQKTYAQGVVSGLVEGEGMQIVAFARTATGPGLELGADERRVEFVFDEVQPRGIRVLEKADPLEEGT